MKLMATNKAAPAGATENLSILPHLAWKGNGSFPGTRHNMGISWWFDVANIFNSIRQFRHVLFLTELCSLWCFMKQF